MLKVEDRDGVESAQPSAAADVQIRNTRLEAIDVFAQLNFRFHAHISFGQANLPLVLVNTGRCSRYI